MSKGVRPKGENSKFVQIAAAGADADVHLYALDSDGDIWVLNQQGSWVCLGGRKRK